MTEQLEGKVIELYEKYVEIDDVAEILGLTYQCVSKRVLDEKIRGAKRFKTLIPLDYVLGQLYEQELKNNQ